MALQTVLHRPHEPNLGPAHAWRQSGRGAGAIYRGHGVGVAGQLEEARPGLGPWDEDSISDVQTGTTREGFCHPVGPECSWGTDR